ncbi:MAG TPA: helix-turn-helix transcriptional regulator [Acidobacteriota bacterium]|nr:helix-turn-helix transcriptional regulator [Acidobacteriota bacterium]
MRHSEHESGGGVVKLTPAEAEVVAQVVRGLTNKEVARALRKSDLTVKNQLASVYRKLGLKRRLQLIAQFRA